MNGTHQSHQNSADDDDLPAPRGLPLGFRILAGVGAAAFVMIGVNILVVGLGLLKEPPAKRPLPPPTARRDDLVLFSTQRLIAALEPKIKRGTPVRSVHFEPTHPAVSSL